MSGRLVNRFVPRLRFGAALLLLAALAAAGCGSPDKEAIAAVEKLGGRVKLDDDKRVVLVDLSETRAADGDLAVLAALSSLETLNCTRTQVTGSGLDALAPLTRLDTLFLVEAPVDDASVTHIAKLSSLRVLHLGRTKITDAGLAKLNGMSQLQTLVVQMTKTTPGGVQSLRQSMPKTQIIER